MFQLQPLPNSPLEEHASRYQDFGALALEAHHVYTAAHRFVTSAYTRRRRWWSKNSEYQNLKRDFEELKDKLERNEGYFKMVNMLLKDEKLIMAKINRKV